LKGISFLFFYKPKYSSTTQPKIIKTEIQEIRVQFPYEDAKKRMIASGMNARMADLMIEMNKAFNDGLVVPTQSLTGEHQGHLLLEEFVKFVAGAYAQS
jgi:hypothetical protein